jgi:hypothetical protein
MRCLYSLVEGVVLVGLIITSLASEERVRRTRDYDFFFVSYVVLLTSHLGSRSRTGLGFRALSTRKSLLSLGLGR